MSTCASGPRRSTSLGCENLHTTHNTSPPKRLSGNALQLASGPAKATPPLHCRPLSTLKLPRCRCTLLPARRLWPGHWRPGGQRRALPAPPPLDLPIRLGCELTMQQKAEPTPARAFARRRAASAHHRTRVVKRLLGNRNGRRRQMWADSALVQSATGMPRALARKGACAGALARARSRARAKAFASEQLRREHGRQHMPHHPHIRTQQHMRRQHQRIHHL